MGIVDKIHKLRNLQEELQFIRYTEELDLSKAFKVVLDDMDVIIDQEIEGSLQSAAEREFIRQLEAGTPPPVGMDVIGEWLEGMKELKSGDSG